MRFHRHGLAIRNCVVLNCSIEANLHQHGLKLFMLMDLVLLFHIKSQVFVTFGKNG
jgi:hypothetical protein